MKNARESTYSKFLVEDSIRMQYGDPYAGCKAPFQVRLGEASEFAKEPSYYWSCTCGHIQGEHPCYKKRYRQEAEEKCFCRKFVED